MDENPYKAPADGRAPVNAINWKRIASGIAVACAIAAAVAILGMAVGGNVSKQLEGERQSLVDPKASEVPATQL